MCFLTLITVAFSEFRFDVGKADFGGCKWLYIVHRVIFTLVLHAQDNVGIDIWIYHSTRLGAVIPTVSFDFPFAYRMNVLMWRQERLETSRCQISKIDFKYEYIIGRVLRVRSQWRPQKCSTTSGRSISWVVSDYMLLWADFGEVRFEKWILNMRVSLDAACLGGHNGVFGILIRHWEGRFRGV